MRVSPRRTRFLLRIRRLILAQQRAARPDWPDEALHQVVTADMLHLQQMPIRKIRIIHAALAKPVAKPVKPVEAAIA